MSVSMCADCCRFFLFVVCCYVFCVFFFFFQAEDGIRDLTVTGVQTCALPICQLRPGWQAADRVAQDQGRESLPAHLDRSARGGGDPDEAAGRLDAAADDARSRSEERRVGKECRSRWVTDHEKKKEIK